MSSCLVDKIESEEWVEDLQRKVFEECIAQAQGVGEKTLEPSTTSDDELLRDVPISVIVNNIHHSFSQFPHFSKGTDFLNELSKSLQMVAHEKRSGVNWVEFRDSSERWFVNLLKMLQDGNNNMDSSHSDYPADQLDKEVLRGEETESNDGINLCSLNRLDTMASCYSLDSSSFGLGTTDGTVESSEETDRMIDDVTGIDLKVRFRRYTEEKANLTDELTRAEDTITSLEQNLKLSQKSLEKMTDKCTLLRKEVDDQRDLLAEFERREESCKLELKKLEKSYLALQKKVEKLESEKESITNLKTKIDDLNRQNSDLAKQLAECKAKFDEKIIECGYLQEENDELHTINIQLEKSHEKNLQDQQEKIQELQNFISELQSQNLNKSDSSSQFSLTPPPYNQANIHSTPYRSKRKSQDSLFTELKASGYNAEDTKVQELQQEISFCNGVVAAISEQVDEALQEIAAWKNELCSPNVQLVESDVMESFKHKITTLIKLVKVWIEENPSPGSMIKGSNCLGKPDVLPVTKKYGGLTDDQLFGPDDHDREWARRGAAAVTSSSKLIAISGVCFDRATSPIADDADEKVPEDKQEEVFVPIVEALNRIIALKGTEETAPQNDERAGRSRIPRKKPIFSPLKYENLKNLVAEAAKFKESIAPNPLSAGDGPHLDKLKLVKPTNMKTLKSEFKESSYNPSPDDAVPNIDPKFVTTRKNPYSVNDGVDSTTAEVRESSYFTTPTHSPKTAPRRKFSVYNRSFDVDSLQTKPDSVTAEITSTEKKRSSSTPDVQETTKSVTSDSQSTVTKNELLTTYRCGLNSSDSSGSPTSPRNETSLMVANDDTPTEMNVKLGKPLVLAPTRLKFADSTVTLNTKEVSSKDFSFVPLSETFAVQQSKIISASSDLLKDEDKSKNATASETFDSHKFGRSTFNVESLGISRASDFSKITNDTNDFSIFNAKQNDGTFTVKEQTKECVEVPKTLPTTTTSAASASDRVGGGASISAAPRSALVGRAMSSGEEDSSAESEPAAKAPTKTVDNAVKLDPATRPRSNSCTEVIGPKEAKVEPVLHNVNGDNKINSNKVILAVQEALKENDNPKAFPSWTDERLQESGIASFPDMDSELSENLSEEELKKKYTAFSVGLASDRMTLSKRMILSRRHRDQAEKNLNTEVLKMQRDIKDLAPLCVDSESVERVERVRQQLDMISRCAHRISCTAETLGAVHQERRVSRAVLLADKYLQTLRSKCEKLASELAETKKILAENNIVLEDNLSEMGDDVPRVRYRAVPNNNRTMMARRRASIATISRPVMGSNQDISKDAPRQRNSVSGRVPGVRRPSLCYETPKWEIEKLDRADSSNSIAELREIFEQAESRRQSREENNNSIRASVNNLTSLNNLALISNENTEEGDVWSNTREDIVPEFSNNNEIKLLELNHRVFFRCPFPFINWLADKYTTWKVVLIVAFVAFILFLMNHIVSSSERHGPPASWWSIEEILSQYIQVESGGLPRPV